MWFLAPLGWPYLKTAKNHVQCNSVIQIAAAATVSAPKNLGHKREIYRATFNNILSWKTLSDEIFLVKGFYRFTSGVDGMKTISSMKAIIKTVPIYSTCFYGAKLKY